MVVRMANVNIYLPDALAEQVRAAGLNVSGLCRDALNYVIRTKEAADTMSGEPRDIYLIANAFRQAREERPFDVWDWDKVSEIDTDRARRLFDALSLVRR